MARYIRPEIRSYREKALSHFYDFNDGPHYVYALVNLSKDKNLPFYVGETSNPRKRFNRHLSIAHGGADQRNKGDSIKRSIIQSGGQIAMFCLEQTQDRITGYGSEASWARALSNHGYKLANNWAEHKTGSKHNDINGVRLHQLSLRELIQYQTKFGLRCDRCDITIYLHDSEINITKLKNPQLIKIAASIQCENCKKSYQPHIDFNEEIMRKLTINTANCDVQMFIDRMKAVSVL